MSSSSPQTPASVASTAGKSPRASSSTPKASPNPLPTTSASSSSSTSKPKPKTSPPRKRARTTTTPPRAKSTNDLQRARSSSNATSDIKVLLVGGESATARAMTPLLLARGWHVISVVDDGVGKDAVQAMASVRLLSCSVSRDVVGADSPHSQEANSAPSSSP